MSVRRLAKIQPITSLPRLSSFIKLDPRDIVDTRYEVLLEGGVRFNRVNLYGGETLVTNNVSFRCEVKEFPTDSRQPAWFGVQSTERDFHPFYMCTVYMLRELLQEFNADGLAHPGNWFYHAPESVMLTATVRPPPSESGREDPEVYSQVRLEVERFLQLERSHLRNYSLSYGNRDFSFIVRTNGEIRLSFYLLGSSQLVFL